MSHNIRCEAAKSPRCKCTCGGNKHGIKREGLNEAIGEKYMAYSQGGEVEKLMHEYSGKTMKCLGTCNKNLVIGEFRGYPHDKGLADAEGKKWWVYIHCDRCRYETSFSKIPNRIEEARLDAEQKQKLKEEI